MSILRSQLSFRMRSTSSMPSRASSSVDLMLAVSCGLTLQICLIIALSFRCRRWRLGLVNGQDSLAWNIALQELYTRTRVLKERWWEERTGVTPWTSSRRISHFFWSKAHNHWPPRACLPDSKRKLPPPACQARLELPSVVCRLRGVQYPGTVFICNQGTLSSA